MVFRAVQNIYLFVCFFFPFALGLIWFGFLLLFFPFMPYGMI